MTWAEFKKAVDDAGVKSDDQIAHIDVDLVLLDRDPPLIEIERYVHPSNPWVWRFTVE